MFEISKICRSVVRVIRARTHKMLARIACREDMGLHWLTRLFSRQLVFEISDNLP